MAPGGPTNDRAHINVLAPSGEFAKYMLDPAIVCHGLGRAPVPLLSRRFRVGMDARDSQAEDTLVEGEGSGPAASRASRARRFLFSGSHQQRFCESQPPASSLPPIAFGIQ